MTILCPDDPIYRMFVNEDMKPIIRDCRSGSYNWLFNLQNGTTLRWGKDKEDDPKWSPYGPELLDIEVSTVCWRACPWCYKSNSGIGTNMPFEKFKTVFDKIPHNLQQIAFGIGDIDANPDLFRMFEYCRKHNVIPNVTINGRRMTEEYYDKLAKLCGAVAVSHYDDTCFDVIEQLGKHGLKQINIHQLLAQETMQQCYDVIAHAIQDTRAKDYLKSIVFLTLKPKGNHNRLSSPKSFQYKEILEAALLNEVSIGFDSCGAPAVLKIIQEQKLPIDPASIEPCESTLFSLYIDVNGEAYPCSFTAGEAGWEQGINVVHCEDFMRDVWKSERLTEWRNKLLASTSSCNCKFKDGCRACPTYNITPCR